MIGKLRRMVWRRCRTSQPASPTRPPPITAASDRFMRDRNSARGRRLQRPPGLGPRRCPRTHPCVPPAHGECSGPSSAPLVGPGEGAPADEFPPQPGERILELDALRQQLQRRAEIVRPATSITLGYNGSPTIGIPSDAMCTRSWWVRPVRGVSRYRPSGPSSSTSVSAFGAPGSHTACRWPRRLMMRLRTTRGSTRSGSTAARAR